MADEITRYMDAHSRLNAADRALKVLIDPLSAVSQCISRDPDALRFANAGPPAVPARKQVPSYDSKVVDLAKWPDGLRLKQLFDEWAVARRELEAAWDAVPAERKASLVNPETAPGGRSDPSRRR
jgi:hypothetical protein